VIYDAFLYLYIKRHFGSEFCNNVALLVNFGSLFRAIRYNALNNFELSIRNAQVAGNNSGRIVESAGSAGGSGSPKQLKTSENMIYSTIYSTTSSAHLIPEYGAGAADSSSNPKS
jgi:hypothetical protein